ncbi:MAG TPA: DUF2269 domain-containing protein [Actinomycetota bacterium]|nr:DUF2269 domain-containing protein [Actinomycetota bacterium]
MRPSLRKAVLSAHLAFSVGWIGAVVVYLCLGVAATATSNAEVIRAAWLSMDIAGWYVIVPLAAGSVVTGIVVALGSKWGLFRHYWVVISLATTSLCAVVLVLHMPTVTASADVARTASAVALEELGGDLFHPSLGLVLLLFVHVLNVYKPRGLTKYGWRKTG